MLAESIRRPRRGKGLGMVPATIATVFVMLVAHVPAAAARCGEGAGDLDAAAAARAAIAVACDCEAAASAREYAACAYDVIGQRVRDGVLPPACVRSVRRCAKRSTCGRSGVVVCCRAGRGPKCKLAKPERCAASGWCASGSTSCCDACGADGCVVTSSTTTTTIPWDRVPLPSQCCERVEAAGVCSVHQQATGFSAAAVCAGSGGTALVWGGTPIGIQACPLAGFSTWTSGACSPSPTFPPTSFCCEPFVPRFPCQETVATNLGQLASWLVLTCNFNGQYPAAVGHCVQSSQPSASVCTPGG